MQFTKRQQEECISSVILEVKSTQQLLKDLYSYDDAWFRVCCVSIILGYLNSRGNQVRKIELG